MSKRNPLRTVTKKALYDAATKENQRAQLFAQLVNAFMLLREDGESVTFSTEALEKAKGINVQFRTYDGGLELLRVV